MHDTRRLPNTKLKGTILHLQSSLSLHLQRRQKESRGKARADAKFTQTVRVSHQRMGLDR